MDSNISFYPLTYHEPIDCFFVTLVERQLSEILGITTNDKRNQLAHNV